MGRFPLSTNITGVQYNDVLLRIFQHCNKKQRLDKRFKSKLQKFVVP